MDWNVGIGIGLQGRPQMFEGVARAREAAAQQYQAKKQQQKADKLQKTQQTFLKTLEGKNFLPIDEQRVSEGLMEIEDLFEQQAESSEPDMFSITKATTNFLQMANKADEQRNRMLKIFDRPFEGFSEEDARIVMSNSDPKVIKEQLALYGSGGLGFSEETGEFFANPIKNFTGTSEFAAKFTKDFGDRMFTDSLPDEEITINNTKFRAKAVNPQMRQAFIASRLSGDNLEMVRREMNMSVWRGKPKPEKGSQEEMEAMIQYVGNVFDQNIQPLRIYDRAAKGAGISLTVNNAKTDEPGAVSTEQKDLNIYSDISRQMGLPGFSTTSIGSIVIPNTKLGGISVPTNAYNARTGKRITETSGTVLSSKIDILPVYKGKALDVPTGQNDASGRPMTFRLESGMIVPNEILASFGARIPDQFEFKKMAVSEFKPTGENSQAISIYYPAGDLEDGAVNEKSGKERVRLTEQMNLLNKLAKENKDFTPAAIQRFKQQIQGGGEVIDVQGATPAAPKPGARTMLKFPTYEEWSKMPANKGKSKTQYFSEKAKQ